MPVARPPLQPSLVIQRLDSDSQWTVGRAEMRYRDLIPDRQGGRFIASHISIPDNGPVPDYVHYHDVHFQMIYCYRGWVRVVYEDQGAPFVLNPGDCVLQPPHIRHRVLEASDLEVIEIASPAEHETRADEDLRLPTDTLDALRDFSGQRFLRHQASEASWLPWSDGFEARDLGLADATRGIASGHVVRPTATVASRRNTHEAELQFSFVTAGSMVLELPDQRTESLSAGDCCVVPAGVEHAIAEPASDLELLIVSLHSI